MPNTTIQLKKSSTPSSVPADLANGELAINFADGKLFYKNTAGFVVEFSSGGGNFFGTVNANSTLIVADTSGDVLTIEAGSGIAIVGDAVNDKLTISATGTSGSAAVALQADANNATRYLVFANNLTGNLVTANVTSGLTFNPSSNTLTINGALNAQTKSFVISHPTKDGKFLRYGSLEGPENGVYVRGKIEGKSIIELPEYWWNLIDEETITVNLTPYGRAQEIWVQSTSSHFIYLNQPADCFFTVFAERKDVDKLIVEY